MDFGFFFDRILHFYGGLSYRELLDLPIRAFWRLHANINRIRAEADLRSFMVSTASQSTEGAKFRDHLVIELGETTKIDPIAGAIRDEKGVEKLKALVANSQKKRRK